jgi:hypothetical protein
MASGRENELATLTPIDFRAVAESVNLRELIESDIRPADRGGR